VVGGDTVYVGAKSGYAAYDLATGGQRWVTRFTGTRDLIADEVGDKWGSYASPVLCGDLLVAFVPRRALVAMNREYGRIVWERELQGTQDWWAAPVAVPDKRPEGLCGDLLVSGGDDGKMILLKPDSGEALWHREVIPGKPYAANYVTGLAVEGERVFAGTVDGQVLCCSLETGEILWRFQSGENLLDMAAHHRGISTVLAPPLVYRDRVIGCGVDGGLYTLDPASGQCVSRTQFDAPISAAPCILDDGLSVATWDGRLYRFAADDAGNLRRPAHAHPGR
jgi:outer membrane protein assembly factor BamB